MMKISNKDLLDVKKIDDLTAQDLKSVYVELEINQRDIDTAKAEADTGPTDFRGHSYRVLQTWRQRKGKLATRETLLDTFERCGLISAKEELEKIWGLGKK